MTNNSAPKTATVKSYQSGCWCRLGVLDDSPLQFVHSEYLPEMIIRRNGAATTFYILSETKPYQHYGQQYFLYHRIEHYTMLNA